MHSPRLHLQLALSLLVCVPEVLTCSRVTPNLDCGGLVLEQWIEAQTSRKYSTPSTGWNRSRGNARKYCNVLRRIIYSQWPYPRIPNKNSVSDIRSLTIASLNLPLLHHPLICLPPPLHLLRIEPIFFGIAKERLHHRIMHDPHFLLQLLVYHRISHFNRDVRIVRVW